MPVAIADQVDAFLGKLHFLDLRVLERPRRDEPLEGRVQRFDMPAKRFVHGLGFG
jgi:hypothetical protein